MARLIRYCEGVMEATWLTALVCVPLFFVLWGNSIQDAKSYLLRSFAVVLLTAWGIRSVLQIGLEAGASSSKHFSLRSLLNTPLALPVLLLCLVLVISTLFSLSPWVSFWGTAVRRSGTYTTLSCIIFFAIMAASIRSNEQVSRIITVIILTSIPVCIYGIEQRYHLGPIISRETGLFRVGSTMGNPVFLAAYVIMVLPLTLYQLLVTYQELKSAIVQRRAALLQLIVYGLVLFLQLWAIFFTISRGPFVGLVFGSLVMFLTVAIYLRKKWLVAGALTLGGLTIVATALFVWTKAAVHPLANREDVQRLTSILDPHVDTSGRKEIWQLAAEAARFSKIMDIGDGRKDPLFRLRAWIGYGPETVAFVSRAYTLREYNIALPGHPVCDRIHNEFWDTLLTTGFIGLCMYMACTFLVLYFGCKWMGLLAESQNRTAFWLFIITGGLLGTLALVSWRGIPFLGVALRFGTLMGLMTFLVWVSWREEFDPAISGIPSNRAFILMALISGIVAHFIEINFSFGVESTLFYFWIFVALLLVVGHRLPLLEEKATTVQTVNVTADSSSHDLTPSSRKSKQGKTKPASTVRRRMEDNSAFAIWYSWRDETIAGIVIALILVNLGVILIVKSGTTSTIHVILDALTRLPSNNDVFTWSLLLAVILTCLLAATAFTVQSASIKQIRPRLQSWMMTILVGLILALVYWLVVAKHRTSMIPVNSVTLESLGRFLIERRFLVKSYYAFVLLLILIMASLLIEREASNNPPPYRWAGLISFAALAMTVGGLSVVYNTNMRWSMVESTDHWAEHFQGKQKLQIAAAICEAAIQSTPKADHEYFFLGKVLTEQAAANTNTAERISLFSKADQVLEMGSNLRPIDHAFLIRRGNLYLKWGETEQAAEKRASLGKKAIDFYRQAIVLDPGNDDLWYRLGYTGMVLLRSPDQSLPWLIRSIKLYPNSHTTHGLLGDAFFYKADATQNNRERDILFMSAATNYIQAAALSGTNDLSATYRYTVALGKSHKELREPLKAIPAYQSALRISPLTERWMHEESLARLFGSINDKTNAIEHVRRAIELAPPDKQSDLMKFQNQALTNQ